MSDPEQFWSRADVQPFVQRAEAAMDAGDDMAELAVYDELVANYPDAYPAWSARGLCLEKLQRFDEALAAFQRSTSLEPSYPDHFNAANMLLVLNRDSDALAELEASIALNELYADAWCNRGIALAKLGRPQDARASFERAEKIDPKLANAFRCHAILLHDLGDHEDAVKLRARVVELMPQHAWAHLELAQQLGESHDPRFVQWELGGVEDQIVDAIDHALALTCTPEQQRWAWAEKIRRLQRIAHARQAAHRAGIEIDELPAIARYRAAAEQAVALFPDEAGFAQKLADANTLG